MYTDLKKCPICGCDPVTYITRNHDINTRTITIRCLSNCENSALKVTHICEDLGFDLDMYREEENRARNIWNKHVDDYTASNKNDLENCSCPHCTYIFMGDITIENDHLIGKCSECNKKFILVSNFVKKLKFEQEKKENI